MSILSCDILDVIPLGFGPWNSLLSTSTTGSLGAFPAIGRLGVISELKSCYVFEFMMLE